MSPTTSSTDDTSASSNTSNRHQMTSEFPQMPVSTDTTEENTKHISYPETGSLTPVTSILSVSTGLREHSTARSSVTSASETTASSQSHRTQPTDSTRESQSSTRLAVITTTPSSSLNGHTLTESTSQETSTSGEARTSSPSSISHKPSTVSEMPTSTISTDDTSASASTSNRHQMTSEFRQTPISTDTTVGNTKHTSYPETANFTVVTSIPSRTTGVEEQSTAPSSITSASETTASSQSYGTQTMDTIRESQTSTISAVITSTPSFSLSGHTLTESISQETSTSGEAQTSSPSSVSHKPSTVSEMPTSTISTEDTSASSSTSNRHQMTSEFLQTPTSTDTTVGNTKHASYPETASFTAVTSILSRTTGVEEQSTAPSSITSTPETSASSQSYRTQTMETIRESQTSTISAVITSTFSLSLSGHTLTEGISQETSTPENASTSSPSSVSHKPSATSEMPLSTSSTNDTSAFSHASNSHAVTSEVSITPASTDTTVGYTKHATHPEIGSFTPVTSTLSRATGVEGHTTPSSSITSTAEMTASSHDYRTQSTETSRESQTDTTSVFITSTPSSSLNGHTLTEIVSQEISTSRKESTLSSSSVSIAPLTTSVLLTAPTSTDTTVGNGKDTSTPITRTVIPVPSTVPMKSGLEVQSIAIFSSTSTPGTSASTQNYQTPSLETTRESEFSEITSATTSALLSLPSGHTLSGRIPPEISPSGEAITSPTSSDSKTPLMTSETLTASTSIDTTVENTGDTSLPVTSSFPPFIPNVSTTWQSAIQPTPLSISTPAPKTSTVFHTHADTETAGWPHSSSSMSFIPDKTTFTSSSFSDSSHTTQSQKELFSTPMASTILVTESSSSSIASSISWVTSTVSTVDEEVPTPHSYLSTSPQETTVAISKSHWTQGIGTTGDIHVSRSSNVTQTIKTVTSASPSSLLSEHTSQQTITASPARQSTPLSSSTSSQESSVVSQIGHTQGPRTTQESQTTSLIFPMTDTIKTVTSATSPFKSSGHLPSENVPQDTPTTGEVTTFTPAPSRDSHTTQVTTTTTELWTSPTSADTSPGTLRGTSLSIKSTTFQSSVVSTTLGPRGQSTSPASSASPDTSAISQTHQTQSRVTTGEPHTNTPASLVTDTTFLADTLLVGTATASSSTASSQTTLGNAFPGISTSDKIKSFSPTFFRENHITQSKTELLSSAASHDTTPGTMELVSVIVPNTSQEISAVSQKAQTQIIGSTRGSEAISSVSQVTDTFSTVIPLPPSSTPNVHMLPKTTAHTLSSSDTSTTLISNPVRDSHRTQTAMPTLLSGATEGPTTVVSTTLSDVASHSPSTVMVTSEVQRTAPSSALHKNMTAVTISPVGSVSNSMTNTMQVPTSSVGESSSPISEHPATVQTVASTTNPTTRPMYMSSKSNHNSVAGSIPTLSFQPTTYSSIKTTPDTSSVSKYSKSPLPTLQPSTDYAFSDFTSSGNMGTAQTISSFYTSTSDSSFSQSAPGPAVTWSSTTLFTGHSAPLSVTSTFPASTASSSSIVKTQTPGAITTSLRTGSQRSTTTSLPPTTSQTLTTSTPSTSTSKHSTAVPVPIKPKKGVSLFPYGPSVGDQEFVRRTVDFTSPLFKPQIGFPLGSSLRDYLYFTDNGQIIFPESEYQIFSYPNPPLRGFTGWDPVALVAPFWDDADFSSSHGTIFYQEYETLYNEHNLLVWQVESWIKKFAHIRNYKARWTLKVTWVSAPAYPAQWTFGTNTYQAILSTDGSRSYALFLYQSGGMQWDVTQRPGNPVLMGFSSGDGYFENSPLTFQPVWEKYHPDQFLNSNSGLQGLQVYRLHREERPNYRLRCLQWLNRQPQWPQWGWNQVSCPCSWQQGLWDLRFQPISIGWWGLGSRQLCRVSSWRGGVCCSYGPWGELLQGWTVSTPWQFDQELEPWDWCCRGNDKPSFCALYQQRRPRISCAGYRPPRPAWMFGDPHITTLDGANYTFNGLGDFLLVRAWDRNSSFLLQGRTAQTSSAQATNFIAFAAKYNTSSLNPITVRWLLKPNDTIHVQVNNQTVTFETNREDPEGQETFNTTGVVMTRNGSLVSASFDGTVTISVTALSNILHASCSLPEEYRNSTEGLLGVWNDNPDDDFRMPNGSTILNKSDEWQLYQFGMTWKINDTRLLGKRDSPLPSNFTPVFLFQLKNNTSGENLVSECNGDEQCIYDSLATGNTSTGLNTKMLFSRYQLMNATLSKYPPSIKGEHVVEAYLGQTKLTQYTSGSENVIFTLRNSNTDFKLFENGTLLWTPKLLEPFTLEILARNAKVNLSSVLQPKTVVCACREESQCLYNQTSWVGNSSLEVAGCKCDGNSFGPYCKRSRDPCEEPCFPNVKCIPGEGCEACPQNLTGDGRHCAALENSPLCQNVSCPVNHCYNQGHCYISQTPDCHPTCTCPPAFTDTRCFVAGNNFTPTIHQDLPVRIIQLSLREGENATMTDVNASVAYRLGKLDVRAFLQNSKVVPINSGATQASGRNLQRWSVISEFQYLPRGPVIDFLNTKLLDAVVEAFLPQASWRRWNRSEGPRTNVNFHSISREDVYSVKALNVSMLKTYFKCNGYKGYHLVYSPHSGLTCVSPCSEGYCEHGGQCQHLPQGPRCSCVPFSIYTPWGERCEHLSMKLGAFFGILFGALGALLLLGVVVFVVLRFWCYPRNQYSYPLDTES
ncbi:mucin-4 isoform X1 [Felis catus]|uniref:mucin-4 isoform X1 n=1 Tax=Felis catus TaxID=9685 RepID=UPI001D1A218E|nr:mucin-4 isoform X1 [Felis catus]